MSAASTGWSAAACERRPVPVLQDFIELALGDAAGELALREVGHEGADLGALSALAQIDWTDRAQCTHHCVWQPPEDDKERAALLEASVREEFKPFL